MDKIERRAITKYIRQPFKRGVWSVRQERQDNKAKKNVLLKIWIEIIESEAPYEALYELVYDGKLNDVTVLRRYIGVGGNFPWGKTDNITISQNIEATTPHIYDLSKVDSCSKRYSTINQLGKFTVAVEDSNITIASAIKNDLNNKVIEVLFDKAKYAANKKQRMLITILIYSGIILAIAFLFLGWMIFYII